MWLFLEVQSLNYGQLQFRPRIKILENCLASQELVTLNLYYTAIDKKRSSLVRHAKNSIEQARTRPENK